MLLGESILFKAGKIITVMMKTSIVNEKAKINHGTSKQYALVWLQIIFPGELSQRMELSHPGEQCRYSILAME